MNNNFIVIILTMINNYIIANLFNFQSYKQKTPKIIFIVTKFDIKMKRIDYKNSATFEQKFLAKNSKF